MVSTKAPAPAQATDGKKGLLVIGAGLGRTGTLSTKAALELLLGGRCHHMTEVFESQQQRDWWTEIVVQGKPADWPKVMEKYRASVDFPTCMFYKELMVAFPDAVVLLTVRDSPDAWFKSWCALMATAKWLRIPAALGLPPFAQMVTFFRKMKASFGFPPPTFFPTLHAEEAKARYTAHNEEVARAVPATKLLVFNVKQGWAPLVDFLNASGIECAAPLTPYPHLNESAKVGDLFTDMVKKNTVAIQVGLVASVAAAAAYAAYRRKV